MMERFRAFMKDEEGASMVEYILLVALIPGAVVVGVGFLAVNVFTQLLIVWLGNTREDTYGALGLAATILFSLWLTSRVIVVSAVVNAALWSRRAAGDTSSPG